MTVCTLAESFYNVKYGSSIITSESLWENLSKENKHWCFCCLKDKTRIKMPKSTGNTECLFSLLRFSDDKLFDITIDDPYLTLKKDSAIASN